MSTPEMVWQLVSKPFRSLVATLEDWMENNALAASRMAEAQKVARMSDEELAELGMSRTFAMQIALRSFT